MNKRNHLVTVILTLTLALVASAAAFADSSRKLVLRYDMTLKGTPLAQGEYTVSWVNHSPEATVTLAKKNNAVATVQGRMVDAGRKFTQNAVLFDEAADGTRIIREIRLAGASQALVFSD
jgi:hypothetical protein